MAKTHNSVIIPPTSNLTLYLNAQIDIPQAQHLRERSIGRLPP